MGDDSHETKKLMCALGKEIQRARDTCGWTRRQLINRLDFEIHEQTLAGYERGFVNCSTARFVKLCAVMGVSPADLMTWAMQRCTFALDVSGVHVDLHAIVRNTTAQDMLPVRRWARRRLEQNSEGLARLTFPVVQEMAIAFGFEPYEFLGRLLDFTPHPMPVRR